MNVFHSFLHHKLYPANRTKIFKSFPELQNRLENSQDEKIGIKSFLMEYYEENKTRTDEILQRNTMLFENKSSEALKALSKLMNYQWENSVIYTAVPTILPFSPFKDTTFFFSILADLNNKTTDDKNALSVAIHEISHMIFLKQVDQLLKEKMIPEISKETINYLKESLAAILLNESPLVDILGIKNYRGNPEMQELSVEVEGGEQIEFSDLIRRIYLKITRDEGMVFETFLEGVIKYLEPIDLDLQRKWQEWCNVGMTELR